MALMDALKIWKADDETVLTLRRLNESDTQRLISFVKGLSVTARYFRFGQGDYDHKWSKLANIKKYEFPYPEGRFFDLRFKDQIIVRGKSNKKG